MKTSVNFIFLALTAILIVACSKKPVSQDTPYVIEGELTGLRDSLVISLFQMDGSVQMRKRGTGQKSGGFCEEGDKSSS